MKIDFPYTREMFQLRDLLSPNSDRLRLVGGCIRNFMLGEPMGDFDMATTLAPQVVTERLTAAGLKVVPTGFDHGTVTAVINHMPFEITTTRRDVATDGRHAEVLYGSSFEEDAGRRDFTFNAFYLDFDGNLYDYFNGMEDLKNHRIRFIGSPEDRIKEDYLRILRFFRFFAHYADTMDRDGLRACVALKNGMANLSGERIRTEMFRIFDSPKMFITIKIMQQNNMLGIVTGRRHGDLERLARVKTPDVPLVLAIFCGGMKFLDNLKNRWKMSNEAYRSAAFLIGHKNDRPYRLPQLRKLAFHTENKAWLERLIIYNAINNNFSPEENLALLKSLEPKKLPLNGNDIKKLGYGGEDIGLALGRAEDIFIKSNFTADRDLILAEISKPQ